MSYNIPLINPTEEKNQDDIGNLKTDKEKYMALNKLPSLDKSGSLSKTET